MANAKYLYLMIKTHRVTGLKYLCKKVTTSDSNNVMRRRPDVFTKMIATKNTIEYKEAARLRAIEINSRPDVKEKIIQSKLGQNNPAADLNIYILKHKETNNLIEGTRFELIEKMKKLNILNSNIKILSNGDIGEFNRKNRKINSVKGWIKI